GKLTSMARGAPCSFLFCPAPPVLRTLSPISFRKWEGWGGAGECMRHTHGSIEVVCGSMFSGKTDELIRRLVRATIAKQKVQVFKPAIDVRYAVEKVTSHAGSNYDATPVEKSINILTRIEKDTTVVA